MTSTQIGSIKEILIGKASRFTRPGSMSAIDKHPLQGRCAVSVNGIEGDEQGDRRVHGGPEKALHIYPFEHYAYWQSALGNRKLFEQPGAFGENISSIGITEKTICIGDQIQVNDLLLEVSQGRQPCWKLNDRFEMPDMAKRLQDTLKTGWYFKVLKPGTIAQDDKLELIHRPWQDWTMHRLMLLMFQKNLDPVEINEALHLPINGKWKGILKRRMVNQKIECWSQRLLGPEK